VANVLEQLLNALAAAGLLPSDSSADAILARYRSAAQLPHEAPHASLQLEAPAIAAERN